MNKEVLLTVLGVIGTLGGTLLGWLLNAYTYRIGRTEIHGTFETRILLRRRYHDLYQLFPAFLSVSSLALFAGMERFAAQTLLRSK